MSSIVLWNVFGGANMDLSTMKGTDMDLAKLIDVYKSLCEQYGHDNNEEEVLNLDIERALY